MGLNAAADGARELLEEGLVDVVLFRESVDIDIIVFGFVVFRLVILVDFGGFL